MGTNKKWQMVNGGWQISENDAGSRAAVKDLKP
jgi:hypothetical protein